MKDGRSLPHPYKPFLNVHVVWHPGLQGPEVAGRTVAERLYREFCRDPERPMSPAVGVPVYFHTSPRKGLTPPPIELHRAHHSVAVFLVNPSMVVDRGWQDYARELGGKASASGGRHLLLPVSLFKEGGTLDVGPTQGIRLDAGRQGWEVALRLQLAAALCRLMQNRPRNDDTGSGSLSFEPPQLFISHAKRDALRQAEDVKRLVEDTPALDTFFDRVDIAAGHDFTEEIKGHIRRSAVLAWQSDEYASRPWCNIELLTAKEYLRPIVVVLGLKSGEERSFPYLGNVRTIVATPDNSAEIIAAAVREYVRKLYAEGRFQALVQAGLIPETRLRLFRPPEPIDAALIQRKAETGEPVPPPEAVPPNPAASTGAEPSATASGHALAAGGREWVLYPDPPLGTAEAEILDRLFPSVRFVTPTMVDGAALDGMKVALSISESDDLLGQGQSELHLLAAMIELARNALSRRAVIAYGGDLREKAQYGYTVQLFELVRAYRDLGRAPLHRILNFLAFHVAAEFSEEREANLLELATFERVAPPPDVAARFGPDPDAPRVVPDDAPDNRYARARCLTAMRQVMTGTVDARVVLGGRVAGHQGKYPGVLEEAHLALRARKPLYLVGGFGGCARLLARAVAIGSGRSRSRVRTKWQTPESEDSRAPTGRTPKRSSRSSCSSRRTPRTRMATGRSITRRW